ncbi:hypothetical protein LTR10_010784 [Elasticomyces elasticus]|nr:hypothetical protein LTR10_010784 [Elasticomyces elasticus]KAK4968390.1 hypothetical protein LTR42_009673 [Elasticomyces elasticus]
MGDSSVVEDGMVAETKIEGGGMAEGTPSSVESTPEAEVMPGASQEQPALPVKRKGGRKPIYATSEERKQRNRQAQAAFRERRTEYIKQLEAQIKQNEDSLASLQQSHRTAADECLMLRYKNSLLERILLEKGIDVQAELQVKTGSPILGPGFMPPGSSLPHPRPNVQTPLQRAAVQQQHARRSGGAGFLPKLAPGQSTGDPNFAQASPGGHPTPSSHSSSPTNVQTRSPSMMHQGGMTPPVAAALAQSQAQQYQAYSRSSLPQPTPSFYQQQRPPPPSHYQGSTSTVSSQSANLNPPLGVGRGMTSGPSSASTYYPSPFQKHIDQLEQEYDTQQPQSMLDHSDHPDPTEHATNTSPRLQGSYPPQYGHQRQPSQQDYYQQQQYSAHAMAPPQHYGEPQRQQAASSNQLQPKSAGVGSFPMGQGIDPNDPMLDADPFGLSASMHYPTAYSAVDHQPPAR